MKLKLFFLLIVLCFCSCACASDLDKDELMWESAYAGDFSLVHKMMLARPQENVNDELLNHFVMFYVHFRAGNLNELGPILKEINSCIERKIILKD